MSKIKRDFIGLYVSAGGYISRPLFDDNLDEFSSVKARHRVQTTNAVLTLENKEQHIWTTTDLGTTEYNNCKKNTLHQNL